eukprot:980879-Rhodomonas_salina.1
MWQISCAWYRGCEPRRAERKRRRRVSGPVGPLLLLVALRVHRLGPEIRRDRPGLCQHGRATLDLRPVRSRPPKPRASLAVSSSCEHGLLSRRRDRCTSLGHGVYNGGVDGSV